MPVAHPAADDVLHFGDWLRDLRMRRQISQADLARRCSLPASYLSAVERNRRPPPLTRSIKRIAEGLALGPGERETLLAQAQQARQHWSLARSARKAAPPEILDEVPGVDPLDALRCMVREAKKVAVEAQATVEVTSKQFRVVVRPDGQPDTDAVRTRRRVADES